MSPTAPLRATLLLAGVLLALEAHAGGHPRLALYHHILGSGYPYTTGGVVQGPFDESVLDAVSRYDEVVIGITPVSEYRPEILSELRLRNPDISILAYVLGSFAWDGADASDSTVHYPTRYRHLLRDLDGYLFDQTGAYYTVNVNLAKRTPLGRYVVAEAIADLWNDVAIRTGVWDGIFIDMYCDGIAWSQSPTKRIDFQRAGYPSEAAFDAGWKAGTEALAARLRQHGGPDFVLVGNCGPGSKYSTFNGWMRENFPFQNGGTWHSNMERDPGGYFVDEARFRTPRHNYIFGAADTPTQPNSAASMREVRYVLGTASLGEGYAVFAPADLEVVDTPYHFWWYDEYAVDLATGRSSTSAAHTGWLGQPVGPRHRMIWNGTGPDASSNPGFEADVTSGWTFASSVAASVARDPTTAADGAASARIDINVPPPFEWSVLWSTTGRINVTAGQVHSATFWARASAPCTVTVLAANATTTFGQTRVPIGTAWQRVQAGITATGSGSAGLVFYLGRSAARLWLDDVHFQAGVSHVWRRDFEQGIVLVNPWSVPMTLDLGRDYRRILGTADPATNNGATVRTLTIPPSDAAFLIGDGTRPATVVDLTPVGSQP